MSLTSELGKPKGAASRSAIFLVAGMMLILAGYGGFRAFASIGDMSVVNLYILAMAAGIASFFSPCAFPLLPGYFSFYLNAQDKGKNSASLGRTLTLGMAAVFGVVTFDLLLGGGIALFGSGFASGLSISGAQGNQTVQILRGAIGVILVVLGIGQFRGWNLKTNFIENFVYRLRPEREGKRSSSLNLYFYGLGYTAAGMGCTGPILAGLMAYTLSVGGINTALTAFLLFSLTMGILMLIISLLVAGAQDNLLTRMKAASPKIKSASGILLLLIGGFNVFSAINSELFLRVLFP